MTPHSFFLILLKILGIIVLKDVIIALPQTMSAIVMLVSDQSTTYVLLSSLPIIIAFVLYAIAINLLLFRTENLVKFLQLTDGFKEETLNFTLHRSQVLNIAIIVFCLYMWIQQIPDLVYEIANYRARQTDFLGDSGNESLNLMYTVTAFLATVCLFFLRRPIVNFIEVNRRK